MMKGDESLEANYKKLAQIRTAISQELDEKYIRNILDQGYDIRYKLPSNEFLQLSKPDLINSTILDCITELVNFPPYKVRILELLLEYDVDFLRQDNQGCTFIHKIFDQHINFLLQIHDGEVKDDIIDIILSTQIKTNNSTNPCNKSGISHFHIACAVNNVEATEFFLNNGTATISDSVTVESPSYAGYTPLHFAMKFHSHDIIKMLLKRNAEFHSKDAQGMSPLQLLVDLGMETTHCSNTDLHIATCDECDFIAVGKTIGSILDIVNLKVEINYADESGFSLLHAACVMTDLSMVEYYLGKNCDINAAVCMDSPIWPGYTAMHFAAHFNTAVMMLLFENGGDVEAKDAKGVTPFDMIATRFKIEDIHRILTSHAVWKNIILSDGKTKLIDLVWAMREVHELRNFLDSNNIDVNLIVPIDSPLWAGYSVLHLAVLFTEIHKIENEFFDCEFGYEPAHLVTYANRIILLINRGADVNAQDARGLVPWQFISHLEETTVVSYLCNNFFIRPGRFSSLDMDKPAGYSTCSWENLVILSIKNEREWNESVYNEFMANLDQQKQMQEKTGLTMLHVACWDLNVEQVKNILKDNKVDVNSQISWDCCWWLGCTALHILMEQYTEKSKDKDKVDEMLQLLIENGANIMQKNGVNCTPLHLTEARHELFECYRTDDLGEIIIDEGYRKFCDSPFTGLLLKQLTDFSLNTKDCYGVSHFHIACIRNDIDVIKQFLTHGADVNEPVDYFSDKYSGHTPLHLAMIPGPFVSVSSRLETVELLLLNGANANLDDSNGDTALHAAAKSTGPREDVLEKLLSYGANINAKNILGETALEVLLLTKNFTVPEIEVFTKRGCEIYNFNPLNQKGYLSTVFRTDAEHSDTNLPIALEKILDVNKLDKLGRTIIHNIISDDKSYIELDLIEYFIEQGCDINHQDNLGKSALHIAAEFQNFDMITILLNAGADINIIDAIGESAFAYSLKSYDSYRQYFDKCNAVLNFYPENEVLPKIIQTFEKHVYKMQVCNVYVSDHIADIQKNALMKFPLDEDEMENVYKQLDDTKNIKFEKSSLTVYDLISISDRLLIYRIAAPEVCHEMDEFFKLHRKSQLQNELNEVFYLIKASYKKALMRLSRLQSAAEALKRLVQFPLPELCCKDIFMFLTTTDLKNLAATMI